MRTIDQPRGRMPVEPFRLPLLAFSGMPPKSPSPSWLHRLWLRIAAHWDRRAGPVELAGKTDRELDDMGLTRADLAYVFDARTARDKVAWCAR